MATFVHQLYYFNLASTVRWRSWGGWACSDTCNGFRSIQVTGSTRDAKDGEMAEEDEHQGGQGASFLQRHMSWMDLARLVCRWKREPDTWTSWRNSNAKYDKGIFAFCSTHGYSALPKALPYAAFAAIEAVVLWILLNVPLIPATEVLKVGENESSTRLPDVQHGRMEPGSVIGPSLRPIWSIEYVEKNWTDTYPFQAFAAVLGLLMVFRCAPFKILPFSSPTGLVNSLPRFLLGLTPFPCISGEVGCAAPIVDNIQHGRN